MKKEDIVSLRFDLNSNGKKIKEGSVAVIIEVHEKFYSKMVVIFIDGSVIKVPASYIKLMKGE
jgi:hypothetical protein